MEMYVIKGHLTNFLLKTKHLKGDKKCIPVAATMLKVQSY